MRSGFAAATGDIILVQDADLSYSPDGLSSSPGTSHSQTKRTRSSAHDSWAVGHTASFFSGIWWGTSFSQSFPTCSRTLIVTDIQTGYKVFKASVIKSIQIEEDRFGVEPEIVAKVAKLGCRIFEVGISYYGRTYAEGKKIGWRDGFRALYAIIKYGCRR